MKQIFRRFLIILVQRIYIYLYPDDELRACNYLAEGAEIVESIMWKNHDILKYIKIKSHEYNPEDKEDINIGYDIKFQHKKNYAKEEKL